MANVDVKMLETTYQVVTVTPVAKAFQLKNRLSRNCLSMSLESSSIEDEMPNGDSRTPRVKLVLGSAIGITLKKSNVIQDEPL
jgi:hypothetical protein